MALRCLYTDLDGTLLGHRGSLFRDADGNFSKAPTRVLEACHRAGVEVVVMSGRREAQCGPTARMFGQDSYIYEAGCGVVIDGEETLISGSWKPIDGVSVAQQMIELEIPELLFDHFDGRLEWHAPWHTDRFHSLLFRGAVDVDEANELIRGAGHEALRFLDNGAIGRPMEGIETTHAYHLVPEGASKGAAVAVHMKAKGYAPEECIACGDSLEDLATASHVGHFFCMANGPSRDEGLRQALGSVPNATVTEGLMGEGVYEAVVSTLAGATGP